MHSILDKRIVANAMQQNVLRFRYFIQQRKSGVFYGLENILHCVAEAQEFADVFITMHFCATSLGKI